jgi:hypothetical protein
VASSSASSPRHCSSSAVSGLRPRGRHLIGLGGVSQFDPVPPRPFAHCGLPACAHQQALRVPERVSIVISPLGQSTRATGIQSSKHLTDVGAFAFCGKRLAVNAGSTKARLFHGGKRTMSPLGRGRGVARSAATKQPRTEPGLIRRIARCSVLLQSRSSGTDTRPRQLAA